ncbi:MAG TPA: hypothetical protein VFZ34_10260 [Blastocatellia bacterium]|nr:hypothetical protein [Blastocatellia bacterium]
MQQAESTIATQLLKAILVKAGLEFCIILVAISLAAYSHLNPPIRGAIDVADATRVAGWAFDPREPQARLEVQLFIDGQWVASRRADERREDLVTAGAATDAMHGFSFSVPELRLTTGKHRVEIYALRAGGGKNKSLLILTKKEYWLEIK